MRTVLPGKPRATLQAVCTAEWDKRRLIGYISGNALVILDGPSHLCQTIYLDDSHALDAVVIDESTGKIATCSHKAVSVYRPYGQNDGVLKWSLQYSFTIEAEDVITCTLSWGTSEELLVGSSTLKLYETVEERERADDERLIWSRALSSPVTSALFSYNASLIASTAQYDRLVKIWRRLSFGSDDVRFDYSYLRHPSTVSGMQWLAARPQEHGMENQLCTICVDNKVRIWAHMNPHGLQVLQLWAEIDAFDSIQPRTLDVRGSDNERYVLFIDAAVFRQAVDNAVHLSSNGEQSSILEHLKEIAEDNPQVCVVMDHKGHMSAWGLRNIGSKQRFATDVFNIAHVENFNIFSQRSEFRDGDHVIMLNFCAAESRPALSILVHHFDGSIAWLEGNVEELFTPSPRKERLKAKALWTGHEGPIKKIVRNNRGRALISRTSENAGLIWKQPQIATGAPLFRSSSLMSTVHIHRTCLIAGGHFVVTLHHQSISVWDTSSFSASEVASCTYVIGGKPLCLLPLPPVKVSSPFRYLATITSKMKGMVWEIELPPLQKQNMSSTQAAGLSLKQFCTFDLGEQDDLAFVLPVDPAGSVPTVSEFLDTFAKDVAISYTAAGVLSAWTARLNIENRSVDWLVTSTFTTGIESPSLASGSSIRKIAVINAARNGLTIWDTRSGLLEFSKEFGIAETIQDLDWTSTPDDQSILAIGFSHKVTILAQIRFDYLDRGPAWAPIREIYIRDSTPHPIGDSTWLGDGHLVIGAGNQLFVYDKTISSSDDMVSDLHIPTHKHASMDLFGVVALLNGPLPVYHPQFLAQCILSGKASQVQKIIVNLNKQLKFFSEGDDLDSFLTLSVDEFCMELQEVPYAKQKEMQADFSDTDEPESVTEDLALILQENLAKYSVPNLTSHEQMHLADLIECMATAEKHRRSMDENAMRYLLFFRQHMVRRIQRPDKQGGVTWREISWAFHSGSQDILVDLVSRHFNGKMLWTHAKDSGMLMWMTDLNALRAQFEIIARNEYTKTDEKNPVDCSLYYLALRKKNVLLGLWRMAAWNREQSGTQKLLSNNFSDPRWKTAALKNAYALMGKRRFEYAAAFFLLAGNLGDAVNVCANQLQDIQLAIAIARVYEGDDGPVLRELLEEKILPLAAFEGNRWLAMWAFWMLGRRDMAVRALISPVYALLDTPETPSQQAKSYLVTDPALVVLYKQLRDKTLQTLKGASMISPRAEWEFVTEIARIYDRMGCDILALDLVRNWEFLKQAATQRKSADDVPDPRKLLRRRSSMVVDDLPVPRSPRALKTGGLKKMAAATTFEEPDSNSLLDSFGF